MAHERKTCRPRSLFRDSTTCATLVLVTLLTIGAHAQESERQGDPQVAETQGPIEEVVVVTSRRSARLWYEFWDWATEPDTLAIAVTLNFTFTLTLSVALTFCCRKRRRDSRDQTS